MAHCRLDRLRRLYFFASDVLVVEVANSFIDAMSQQTLPILKDFKLSRLSLASQENMDRLQCYLAQQRQLTTLKLDNVRPRALPATLVIISAMVDNSKRHHPSRACQRLSVNSAVVLVLARLPP